MWSDGSQNTAGKILELRKAPGSGPLLPGVTGFCLEAFLTVAVNNAAAFLQATLQRARSEVVTGLEDPALGKKWGKTDTVAPRVTLAVFLYTSQVLIRHIFPDMTS